MTAFINASTTLGAVLSSSVSTMTGNMVVSLLIIFIILLAVAFYFSIPMEYTAMFMLPLIIGYMAFYQEFVVLGLIMFIYLAAVITKVVVFR